jgi:hypothetical protein
MKPQPPVTRIRTARASSSPAGVKPHTTDTKETKGATLNENQIAKLVLDAAFLIHTKLGINGQLESGEISDASL